MIAHPDFARVFPESVPSPDGLQRKPRKGDKLIYQGRPLGEVVSVEGNLCWFRHVDSGVVDPFIWQFPREGVLNSLIRIAEDGQ